MDQSYNQQYRAGIVSLAATATKGQLVNFMGKLCLAYQASPSEEAFHNIVVLGSIMGTKELLQKESPDQVLESLDRMIKGNDMLDPNKFKS